MPRDTRYIVQNKVVRFLWPMFIRRKVLFHYHQFNCSVSAARQSYSDLWFCYLIHLPRNTDVKLLLVGRMHLCGHMSDVIQECRTWLNVAHNQELNKASYETVQQSYAAALECARQACDAKLEVLYTVLTHVAGAFQSINQSLFVASNFIKTNDISNLTGQQGMRVH